MARKRKIKVETKEIILEKKQIIVSKRDTEMFFESVINSPKANESLINATIDYEVLFSE